MNALIVAAFPIQTDGDFRRIVAVTASGEVFWGTLDRTSYGHPNYKGITWTRSTPIPQVAE